MPRGEYNLSNVDYLIKVDEKKKILANYLSADLEIVIKDAITEIIASEWQEEKCTEEEAILAIEVIAKIIQGEYIRSANDSVSNLLATFFERFKNSDVSKISADNKFGDTYTGLFATAFDRMGIEISYDPWQGKPQVEIKNYFKKE